MCVGIPMRVVQCDGLSALCEGRDGQRRLDLSLVGEQAPGTWLLAFLDSAREVLDPEAATRIDAALNGLQAALNGETDMSPYFADLIDRPPQLPDFLKGNRS